MYSEMMKKRNKPSVYFKITFSILVTFASIFCVISILIYSGVHALVIKEVENRLNDAYTQISAENLTSFDTMKKAIDDISLNLEVTAYTPDGELIYSNHHTGQRTGLSTDDGFSEIRIESDGEEKWKEPDHYQAFKAYQSESLSGPPPLIIQISKDMEDEDRFFRILLEGLIMANLLGTGLAAFIGYRISRKILHPVDVITGKAKAISAEDLSLRIPSSGGDDEITRLIDAFNEMLGRLENSFERQQRFVADASHELRTPISVIQGYADMLLRWAKNNPELLDESLESIKSETQGMKNLIDRLLALARSDSMELTIEPTAVDLSHLLRETALKYSESLQSHEIRVHAPEGLIIYCDSSLIRQLIRILVDNALKYTWDGKYIDITASTDPEKGLCSVEIKDYGDGIEQHHLPRLFDRFYRVDDARGREKGGAGIGLSLAKEICEAHGGTISVSSRIGDGSAFTFVLPLNN